MQKPLIGITSGEVFNREHPWAPAVLGQSHTYIDSVVRAGGIPIILPVTDDASVLTDICSRLDGLLMSGGNDLNPRLYGENPYDNLDELSDKRDRTEKVILEYALENDIPILGICRGLQYINVHFGGTLYQDIPSDIPGAMDHRSSTKAQNFEHHAHAITIDEDSKLYDIMQLEAIDTNSHHHQSVKEIGEGLRITARAEDGVVEAIESDDDRFIICIQAHPESLGREIPEWSRLFDAFIEKSRAAVSV
jgi:putative glutamine amidotransferase